MGDVIELELPARPDYLALARLIIAAAAHREATFGVDRIEDLRLAVSEACTNAVEAHPDDGVDQRVVLRCVLGADVLEVHVEDSGPRSRPAPTPAEGDDLEEGAEQGWSLQLIRALVDEVAYSTTADDGVVVRLSVHRTAES